MSHVASLGGTATTEPFSEGREGRAEDYEKKDKETPCEYGLKEKESGDDSLTSLFFVPKRTTGLW